MLKTTISVTIKSEVIYIMEYYILKCYENKKKEKHLKFGLNGFTPKWKLTVICLFIGLVISALFLIIQALNLCNANLIIPTDIACVIILVILYILVNKDQKDNLYKHTDEYKKQLIILNKILKKTFNINSKEKILTLIEMYKTYITKNEASNKTRDKLIFTLFTALSAILSTSLANLKNIGIDLNTWINITAVLIIVFCMISLFIYGYKYVNFLNTKYEHMVNDLESLILLKY